MKRWLGNPAFIQVGKEVISKDQIGNIRSSQVKAERDSKASSLKCLKSHVGQTKLIHTGPMQPRMV